MRELAMLKPQMTDEELWALLPTLGMEEVPAFLTHGATKEQHVLKLLTRRDVSEEALGLVAHSRWAGTLRIQFALVNHRNTPLVESMNLVKFLFWRDLNQITQNFQVPSEVRHRAESVLFQRLPAMAIGEKISLARLAGGQVLKTLRLEKDPQIVQALLENPRLVEEDVLYLVCQPRTPAPVLESVARDPKWSARREVRLALLRNAKTPLASAITFISSLTTVELKGLVNDAKVPLAVRRMIEKRLGKG
jgi:hypothetical protein